MISPFSLPDPPPKDAHREIDDLRQIIQNTREELEAQIEEVRSLIRREGGSVAHLTAIGTWIKFQVAHGQFQTAALDNSITLFTLPGRGVVQAAMVIPTTAWAGTGIAQYQLSVGYSGALDAYTPLFDVAVAVADTYFQAPIPVLDMRALTADTAIKVQAVADANLSNSTAGAAEIWLLLAKAS